ncbi:hypothetical protein [Taylorella asinigenitalis]|uniref:hypothetical protein n=1 Tax=Taylorella asinigenitalis TaxID=84590 RepID=UPI00048AC615|nr:hypothetical protein [Taylorella asinigenitalis]
MDNLTNSFSNWLFNEGAPLIKWELSAIEGLLTNTFGYQSIQIGLPKHNYLKNARTQNKAIISFEDLNKFSEADLIILPHTLELLDYPKDTLKLISAHLNPHGLIVILGLKTNPLSKISKKMRACPLPKKRKLSAQQIKIWSAEFEFESKEITNQTKKGVMFSRIFIPSYALVLKRSSLAGAAVGLAFSKTSSIKNGVPVLSKENNNV